jgi:hypothetical protein
MALALADERVDVADGVVAVVRFGCVVRLRDPDGYGQRLVRGAWHATVERQSGADQT